MRQENVLYYTTKNFRIYNIYSLLAIQYHELSNVQTTVTRATFDAVSGINLPQKRFHSVWYPVAVWKHFRSHHCGLLRLIML